MTPDEKAPREDKPVYICRFFANNGDEGKGRKTTAISWDGAPSSAYIPYVKHSAYQAIKERAERAEATIKECEFAWEQTRRENSALKKRTYDGLAKENAAAIEQLKRAREALDWALDEVCRHKIAYDDLEKYPKMNRAFCDCRMWVYRDAPRNVIETALTDLDKFLSENDLSKT